MESFQNKFAPGGPTGSEEVGEQCDAQEDSEWALHQIEEFSKFLGMSIDGFEADATKLFSALERGG